MPQPKKYASAAEKKAAYRARKRELERSVLQELDAAAERAIVEYRRTHSPQEAAPEAIEDELVADVDPPVVAAGNRKRLLTEQEYRSLLSGRELAISLVLD